MGKRFDLLLFPGGKSKVFTLSYDDGVVQDRRLAQIFRDYGLKCTFNLGSGLLGHQEVAKPLGRPELDVSKVSPEEVPAVYAGHEIAGHALYHSSLDSVGTPLAMWEICQDKRNLEKLAGKPLRMFAYPFGRYDGEAMELLRLAGYRGARTVKSTYSFDLPEDFLVWDPTCHHKDPRLMELAEQFVSGRGFGPQLFYVWGHAYEFDGDNNWDVIETLAKFMAGHADQVWFATNGEIMAYVDAYRSLEYSVDGSMIHNPSALDVTIQTAWKALVLPAGKCTSVPETPL